ncbi:MAG: stage III sporulation protein AD [Clostridia bacterium]|nr:MAG: stage III sporulation protein AD [Clostridia bacterium]
MEILSIVGIGLVSVTIVIILRQQRPEMALMLSAVAGVVIFLLMVGKIGNVMDILRNLADQAQINRFYLGTVLKIIGVAYVAEFGSQVCRDAGESAIASRIEFAAKVLIMVMALPIIAAVVESILRLLP